MRAVCIVCSACRPPKRKAGFIRALVPWLYCPRRRKSISRLNPKTWTLLVAAHPDRAARASTRRTAPCKIIHKPSGLIVRCADQRSQQKNKERALTVLRSRLLERRIAEEQAKYAAERKAQVGTGERNERIRTYNFPQNRVTDHRIELTLYNLPFVMEGDMDPIIEPLMAHDLEEKLAELST